jgi:hypothetical protein
MVFDGMIDEGVHCATGALEEQLPLFETQYDELRGAHRGTINVALNQPIDFRIDFSTDRFMNGKDVSRFEFVRVLFEFPLGTMTKA